MFQEQKKIAMKQLCNILFQYGIILNRNKQKYFKNSVRFVFFVNSPAKHELPVLNY